MLYVFVSIVHDIYLSVFKIIHIQWIFVYWIIYLTFSFHLSRHKILRFAVSLIARDFSNTYIYIYTYDAAAAAAAKSCQSYPTLCDPIDGSLPGFSIHGIFQARVLEWDAIAFSDIYIYIFIYLFIYIYADIFGRNFSNTHTHTHTYIYIYIFQPLNT